MERIVNVTQFNGKFRSATFVCCLWTLGLLLCNTRVVSAQKAVPPLDIQVDRQYYMRSEGPVSLRVKMMPTSGNLIQGKLEFKLWNGRELLATLATDDEVINPPQKTVRYVLPTPELRGYTKQLDLTVDFITPQGVTPQGRFKFGPFAIIVPLPMDRDLVVGYVAPETMSASPGTDQLLDSLKFETYSPLTSDKNTRTIMARIYPDQMPPDAVSYCGFNMLFAAGDGFASIKESQWPAILEWVEAGGSLCLLPQAGLSPYHLTLLNQLASQAAARPTFVLGPDSQLLLQNEQEREAVYLTRRGLGVIAIIPLLDEETPKPGSAPWLKTVAHLWRFRRDQTAFLETSGKWNPAVMASQLTTLQAQNQNYYYLAARGNQHQLGYLPINSGDQLIQAIVP